MAIFLSRALVLALLAQGTPTAPPPGGDTLARAQTDVTRDSTEARSWLAMGRAYLGVFDASRSSRNASDTVWTRAILDTADRALAQASALLGTAGTSAAGDTARLLRVRVWAGRAVTAWERGGLALGAQAWGPLPGDLRLSSVLEELGENLLRACPSGGVLFTAGDADSYAAWYMRFVRGLRPDLLVLPWATWRSDSTLRARALADLKLGRRKGDVAPASLEAVVERRPACASMAFPAPPEAHVRWEARPLVWVAAREEGERVSSRDFVFVALKPALDQADPFAGTALALYARAAGLAPALCEALAAFQVADAVAACRR
ncbi:MAG TPA: hypothetical protein VLV16_14815 [Gemmatimonadales bacterium]|nr:hypothetical protein [Gemmatimonadales bacterium]